jgi:hypothetical protein
MEICTFILQKYAKEKENNFSYTIILSETSPLFIIQLLILV